MYVVELHEQCMAEKTRTLVDVFLLGRIRVLLARLLSFLLFSIAVTQKFQLRFGGREAVACTTTGGNVHGSSLVQHSC